MTKPLSYLNDILCIESIVFNVMRNDELSGTGDGRIWQAELAPPLWDCTVNVAPNYHDDAKQVAARIRALEGSKEPFLLVDPISKTPQSDKAGAFSDMVNTIISISSNGKLISINGFPPNFKLTFGDKFSIIYGSNRDKYSFHEVAGEVSANANGQITNIPVFPFIPPSIIVNDVATFYDAPCKMVIYPDTFHAGTSTSHITSGLTFRAIQKR